MTPELIAVLVLFCVIAILALLVAVTYLLVKPSEVGVPGPAGMPGPSGCTGPAPDHSEVMAAVHAHVRGPEFQAFIAGAIQTSLHDSEVLDSLQEWLKDELGAAYGLVPITSMQGFESTDPLAGDTTS